MYIRNCPKCNKELTYKSKSNLNRAIRNSVICRNCSQLEQKNDVSYLERNEKISNARKEYFKNIDEEEHKRQIEKFSESIRNTYLNKSYEWKEKWKETCSKTSKERWSDDNYKERVSNKIKDNNWSKREDKEEIIQKSILKKIEKYGKSNGLGKCKQFIVEDLICDGTHEKFYVEYLLLEGKKLPKNTKSIKTDFGYYTPDFEFDEFYVDIKSTFTLKVLLGFSSYSKNKKSNPKQLLKIKYIDKNFKPIKIILVDVRQNEIIEFSIDDILNLKEDDIDKRNFKSIKD
jgi:hypothetical protein